jgi:hypothetical protein
MASWPRHVVLEMGRNAAVGSGDGLDVIRPPPARLKDQPADVGATDLEDFGLAMRKLADLVRSGEGSMFSLLGHLFLLLECRLRSILLTSW